MAKKKWLLPKIGRWSFIIGVIMAVISGFWYISPAAMSVLVILGVVVGFLNITGQEAMTFLLASVSMIVISSMGSPAFAEIAVIGPTLQRMLNNLIIFVIPAAMIVALRAVITLAHKK